MKAISFDIHTSFRHAPRPRIGITGPDCGGTAAWWWTSMAVLWAGGRPIRITPSRAMRGDALDGLVIGGASAPVSEKAAVDRDFLEAQLVETALRRNLPVLGIGRGAQVMNVCRGGRLQGDLLDFYVEPANAQSAEPIEIAADGVLARLLPQRRCSVPRIPQRMRVELGPRLRSTAFAADGSVQAFEDPSRRFYVGVSWHPERLWHQVEQRALFGGLVAAAVEHSRAMPFMAAAFARAARAPMSVPNGGTELRHWAPEGRIPAAVRQY